MSFPKIKKVGIGRKIQRVREMRGMKQETLASKLGVTQQAVSFIEQSDSIEEERLLQIAEALEVSSEYIKNLKEDPVFVNNVYSTGNDIRQIYSQPISKIEVYNQINNPIEKVVELYEKMLEQKDIIIKEKEEMIKQQAKEIEMFQKKSKAS